MKYLKLALTVALVGIVLIPIIYLFALLHAMTQALPGG